MPREVVRTDESATAVESQYLKTHPGCVRESRASGPAGRWLKRAAYAKRVWSTRQACPSTRLHIIAGPLARGGGRKRQGRQQLTESYIRLYRGRTGAGAGEPVAGIAASRTAKVVVVVRP
jgi:hypothetical protein